MVKMKRCPGCEKRMALNKFGKNKSLRDGHSCNCKECKSRTAKWNRKLKAKQSNNRISFMRIFRKKYPEIYREIGLLCVNGGG